MKYYNLKKILETKSDYNIIIGERSNGKTYALLKHILTEYINGNGAGAYVRRWRDDVIGRRADTIFQSLEANGEVEKITKGKFSRIIFSKGGWHLATYDVEKSKYKAELEPFCYAFALSGFEHDKSTSYPNVTNIVFDEFITRMAYLRDEFIIFMNVLSTIIRERENVKIFMLGNTVNKYAPYFQEMGLKNIETQEQGTIDTYIFASKLKIAVEYCGVSAGKKSNKYFSFSNARLNMIVNGKWEIAIYQHLPIGYSIKKQDIQFTFYIVFGGHTIGCDVVRKNADYFIFCRYHTKEIKENELAYSLNYAPSLYRRKSFMHSLDKIDQKIKLFFASDRVFYLNNEIGEVINNFIIAQLKRV